MSRAVPWDRAACGARPGVAGGVAGALGRLGQREPAPALHSAAGDLGAAAGDLGAGATLCKVGWRIKQSATGHVP